VNPWLDIERDIARATAESFRIERRAAVSGGCIHSAWKVEGADQCWFVKTNDGGKFGLFEAEARGLEALVHIALLRVPRPLCVGRNADASWIVMEHIELESRTAACDALLGAQLAALHRHTGSSFGWHRDNYIGSAPQMNGWADSWPAFWRERRLGFQLTLAQKNGYAGKLQTIGAKLLERIDRFFTSYAPAPALLHGDLWSGNAASDTQDSPVVFDPAVYQGDREADIAMTELFGGYSRSFYSAYDEAYPRDAGYWVRKNLYSLYHVLNHLNLFGGGYLRQAEQMIEGLLAET
jgi:fructosamine-3-kinase